MKTLSVLIPTLGRAAELIATVQGLLKQTESPLEIVIVDQNTPSFPEVDRFLASIAIVRHIHTPVKGLVLNYNRCLREARGDVVLFVDDDVLPQATLVERHLRHYSDQAAQSELPTGGVAGRILQDSGTIPPEQIHEVGTYHRWRGSQSANFNAQTVTPVQFAQGANMSMLREALIAIGGFDQGFEGNGYYFETDAGLRLARAGYRMIFDPEAELFHLMAPSGGARMPDKSRHTYYFVRNGIRLYRRHSPLAGQPFFAAWMIGYVALKSVYNRQPSIFTHGLRAVWDGWRQSMVSHE